MSNFFFLFLPKSMSECLNLLYLPYFTFHEDLSAFVLVKCENT